MTALRIRRAMEEDIKALAEIAVSTWVHAYSEVLTPESMDAGPANLETAIKENWEDIFVAETVATPVGFFEFDRGTSHIRHLFVHPDFHRKGIGSLLMTAALDVLRERGFPYATVDVVQGSGGDEFSRFHGWRETGREETAQGTVIIHMQIPL